MNESFQLNMTYKLQGTKSKMQLHRWKVTFVSKATSSGSLTTTQGQQLLTFPYPLSNSTRFLSIFGHFPMARVLNIPPKIFSTR